MVSLSDELLEGIRDAEFEKDLLDFKAAEQTALEKIAGSQEKTEQWVWVG